MVRIVRQLNLNLMMIKVNDNRNRNFSVNFTNTVVVFCATSKGVILCLVIVITAYPL